MKDFKPENVSDSARKIIQKAADQAKLLKHSEFSTLHVLTTIIHDKNASRLIKNAGGSLHHISKELKEKFSTFPTEKVRDPKPNADIHEMLNIAAGKTPGKIVVGHLILALKETEATKHILEGLNENKVIVSQEYGEALSKYSRDLTRLAKLGCLDPVIGRDVEVRRAIQTLSRRNKNNPVIVGESGVGKTSIVYAIAQRIADNDVPKSIQNLSILQLDLSSIVAGSQYRGQFEERLKGVIQAASEAKDVILFIDDLHTIMGTGSGESGGQDAAGILKPTLANGEIRCIGATTTDAYKKNIEKDPQLERRFQAVRIEEPTVDESISILRGLRNKFQSHHGLEIEDSALVAAAKLSARYIQNRYLPDKAIDLIDEACAELKMDIESVPSVIDERERKIKRLNMELETLDNSRKNKGRKAKVREEISKIEQEILEMRTRWTKEKELIEDIKDVSESLDKANATSRTMDHNRLALFMINEIAPIENRKNKSIADLKKLQAVGSFLRDKVTEEDIAKVVSSWTGVPAEKMLQQKTQKELMKMEDRLHSRVVGQHPAISAVSDAIRQSRAGLTDPNAPMGTFLFMGPTGTGKTELAKALAEFLFDDESAIVRLDMSEYMEKHAVSRLVGSPPGYVGYDEGGQLTEAVRHRPYSLVLLDEVEKAHPDVWNIMLQVFDEGRLTDTQGRTVDFTNTIILLTSNIGSELYYQDHDEDTLAVLREKLLQTKFRPEFINRIDGIVYFHPLYKEHMINILDIQMRSVQKRLKERDLDLILSDNAREWLAENGYDPKFGARPLKRLIKQEVLKPLSNYLLTTNVKPGTIIKMDLEGNSLEIVK